MVTRAKKRRRLEEEDRLQEDRISLLPDDALREIIALLPTKDAARTQVLSPRWRHLWRSTPLNLDFKDLRRRGRAGGGVNPGPCRRFSILDEQLMHGNEVLVGRIAAAILLDGWLRSSTVHGLQELDIHLRYGVPMPLPPPVRRRFSSTLRVARFGEMAFPDDRAGALQLPFLRQLTLKRVIISEGSLRALLASGGCPVLESLMMVRIRITGSPRLQLVSPTLRSIGVQSGHEEHLSLQALVIEDAPCLERSLFFGESAMQISVVSAPRLTILGRLSLCFPSLQIGTTVLQGSRTVKMTEEVRSVKVLDVSLMELCFSAIINLIKCFPCLEDLHIKATYAAAGKEMEAWYRYRKLVGSTLDGIHLRKVVLANYRCHSSHHINDLAKFFVSVAKVLESMRFELQDANIDNSIWIRTQHSLLQLAKSEGSHASTN